VLNVLNVSCFLWQ